MRYLLFLGFGLSVGCAPQLAPTSSQPSSPRSAPVVKPAWSPEMQTIADGNNAFAFDLYAQLRNEPGNLFFSPFSIHTALAMTADGARGETLDEMVKVLHLPKDAKARLSAGDVSKYYAAGGDGYELAVANNLWGQQGFPWKADFLERQRTHFGAELTQLDFVDPANREAARKTINASIEKTTRDKIKELLKKDPPDLNAGTRLVLTNAIYFKGVWGTAFDKKFTKESPFTSAEGMKTVSLMTIQSHFHYLETDEFQAVELLYKGGAMSMLVLLPNKHDGLRPLEDSLSEKNLNGWSKSIRHSTADVILHLPRFENKSQYPLADVLSQKLGMKLAFNGEKADLRGMAELKPEENLSIARVIHQAFVEVNEEGTEAAAATAVFAGVEPISAKIPQPPKVFRADHPFVYLIRDTKTGNILFMGRYTGP